MKKLIWMLVLALTLTSFALAEEGLPFAPFAIETPQNVVLSEHDGTWTFAADATRVVAIVISRVPDEDPTQALIRMMGQFEPNAIIGNELPVAEGFHGLTARTPDRFGKGVDQLTAMLLCDSGHLLILSGYDLQGQTDNTQSLIELLLYAVTVDGVQAVAEPES